MSVPTPGTGMTPEEITSAFEPYFSTKDTGLGLGLALTHKIVSDHGGTIVLESEPGAGDHRPHPAAPADRGRRPARREDLASALVAAAR